MANTEKAENIYELLDIDPSIKLTAAEARKRINDARDDSNKRSNFPGTAGEIARLKRPRLERLEAALYRDRAEDQDVEMELERHRREWQQVCQQRSTAIKSQLENEISFAALKGYILQKEIDAWEAAYKDVVPSIEIERMANRHKRKEQTDKPLSDDRLNAIDKSLHVLGEDSLLSLAKAQPHDSDETVTKLGEALYSEAKRQGTDPQSTAKKSLAGDIRDIFSDPARAQQYRAHVRQQQFYRLYLQSIAVTCDATHEIIDSQVNYLVSRATRDGWTRDEAVRVLFINALQRGWRVLPPSVKASAESDAETTKRLREYQEQLVQRDEQIKEAKERARAAEVEKANAEERARAAKAEKAQIEREFRKTEQQSAIERANAKAEVSRLQRELQDAEKRSAAAQAAAKAGQAKSFDAQQQVAIATAEAQRLRQELAEWQAREAENERERIAHAGPLLTMYMTRAELVAARKIIKSFATLPPQWADDATRIEQGIREAERLLAEAQRATPQEGQAEALVDAALAKCSDLEPARAFKATLLPAPPSALSSRRERDVVELNWNPSPSQRVCYVVIRSVGARPLSARDGSRIATDVKERAWRDTDAPPARPLWYAVYAERDAASSPLAIAGAAVTILPDVSVVQTEVSDATITLGWRLPSKAHSVRVVRNDDHAPQSASDGQPFSLGQTSRYVDTGLVNGRRYYYRVYCEYTGLDGQLLRSDGIGAYAIPTSPPSAVPTLKIRGVDGITNHTVHLDIAEPDQGSLVIYRSTEAPPATAGTTLPITQHKERFGFDRHEVMGKRDTLLLPGAYVYTPVILFQQTALIGQSQPYLYAPAIRSLKSVDDPTTGVQVRWSWPSSKCDAVDVRCQPVTASDAEPTVVQVNRTGAGEGMCVLRNLPHGEYKIGVRARYQFKGQIVYSSEETAQVFHAAPVRVRYRLETQQRLMARHSVLVLTADQPLSLPDIRIVYGRGPLLAPGDGRTLCDFSPDSPLPASTWTVRLPDFPAEPDAQIRVFRASETSELDIIFENG